MSAAAAIVLFVAPNADGHGYYRTSYSAAQLIALRDVAALLRSVDYAVATARLRGAHVPDSWEPAARGAILDAYLATVDRSLLPTGDRAIATLLSIFELEKAVYELRYEMNNRPDWVPIPVAGIARSLEVESA